MVIAGTVIMEMGNLCDKPTFTSYTVDGSNAKYVLVRTDFTCPLPVGLDDVHVAPLLCAGIIDFCDQNHSIA
jgi:propanol-preferring alcohol dehydrogenase